MNGYVTVRKLNKHPFLSKHYSYATTDVTDYKLAYPFTSLQCGCILQSLTKARSLTKGRKLHAYMIASGLLQNNTYLNTKLAAFYANCGCMDEAELVFDKIILKNSFLWNCMIRGYSCNQKSVNSLFLYREMLKFGKRPDNFTYPFVLKACGDLCHSDVGRRVHAEIIVRGLESDMYVANSLLSMYLKFGKIETTRNLFDRMPRRDNTSWNTLISGYSKLGDPGEALLTYKRMTESGFVADSTTLLSILYASTELASLKQGKVTHGYIIRHHIEHTNSFITNSLIEMYAKCNSVMVAREVFEKMSSKDTVAWNSMITGYERNGNAFESLRLFCKMVSENVEFDQVTLVAVLGACDQITAIQFGMSVHSFLIGTGFASNITVATALINTYSKCGSLYCSRKIFDEISNRNLVSWTAMIYGYGIHGRGKEAIALFYEMIENHITPDKGAFTSVLSACSHAGLVKEGKEIFSKVMGEFNLKPNLSHYSCMIDLLGRSGHLEEAYMLVNAMEIKPTSEIWAALLSACGLCKNIELAEISAQKYFEMKPKRVSSYICLSNIYAFKERWSDVERVRALLREQGLKKQAGCSFIELDKMVHRFLVGDKSHPQSEEIYVKLRELREKLRGMGYKADTSHVFYDVPEEVKEDMLWDHSERLAIAFALICSGPSSIIRITKNLRICGDCHTVTKLISKLTCREIIMRDIRRFHHFRDGLCSCGDFW